MDGRFEEAKVEMKEMNKNVEEVKEILKEIRYQTK